MQKPAAASGCKTLAKAATLAVTAFVLHPAALWHTARVGLVCSTPGVTRNECCASGWACGGYSISKGKTPKIAAHKRRAQQHKRRAQRNKNAGRSAAKRRAQRNKTPGHSAKIGWTASKHYKSTSSA